MTPWTTAIAEVRTIISDGDTDKLAYNKKVIGQVNGVNTRFKTFETRRISTLVTPTDPCGVFDDSGVAIPVTSEDLESGQFTVTTAPTDGQGITATYYFKWFNDTELTTFLNDAAQWIGFQADFSVITDDLQ